MCRCSWSGPDGRREAILFALEEESDWRRFSLHRLAHYCLDLAELFETDRVVPAVIFLRAADAAPASLTLGTERRPYLTFDYLACKLKEIPAERWLHSDNLVARVNLPNMRRPSNRKVEVYAQAVRGLLALEPDGGRQAKYLEYIDIYAGLTDNEFRRYQRQYPEESTTMAGVIQRARDQGMQQGMQQGIRQGRVEGERVVLERQLRRRFGLLPREVTESLRGRPHPIWRPGPKTYSTPKRLTTYSNPTTSSSGMSEHSRHDVVIIGGGHNGLICGAYLAKAGLKVVVVEQHDIVGGAAVTQELHPGFRASTFSYLMSLLHPKIIADLNLRQHGLTILPCSDMFSPLDGDDYIVHSDDIKRTQASFARFNQRDAAIYPEFNAYLYEAAAVIRKPLFETPPDPTRRDWKTYKEIGTLLWKYRKIGGKLFQIYDVLTMSADDYLRRWFETREFAPCWPTTHPSAPLAVRKRLAPRT